MAPRARPVRPSLRPARRRRNRAARRRLGDPGYVDRAARAELLRPRRGHRGLPRPRARRRPGLLAAAGSAGHGRPGRHRGERATSVLVAMGVTALARRGRAEYDSATALVLVGALAAGVILASDVFHSQGSVERLLFGSLLIIDSTDQLVAGAVGVAVLAAGTLLGRRWLASGFDRDSARALGA